MKKYIIIVGIIIILAIAGIFALKSFTGKVIAQSDIKEFTVNAFRFGYSPDIITVNKGDKVKIIINNTDTLHGIRIPELNLKGNEAIEFTAEKTGEFDWYCTNMCGKGHMEMKGKLIVK
ncbi:MAG: cupredoxin domain-containing protein [Nanoarchaeota archaeon]